MIYRLIVSIADSDIPYLSHILNLPEISRYISIDKDNYWNYVTSTDNVFYYKVYICEKLVAAVHLEISDHVLFMDIMVIPEYQKQGIGSSILEDIIDGKLQSGFDSIEVSIDKSNSVSIRLFEKCGFIPVSAEDELIYYRYEI